MDNSQTKINQLLTKLKANKETYKNLVASASSHWGYEDHIYRFYHQSFKVYRLQIETLNMVEALKLASFDGNLNEWFTQIIDDGTGRKFSMEANKSWLDETRPIIEAFFHAKFFVQMAAKYSQEFKEAPTVMPSGWAALLSLYNL